jgi:hypothetical protein
MSDLPEIDPCKPIPSKYGEYDKEAAERQEWEDKAFHEDRSSEYYIDCRRIWDKKARKFTKDYELYKKYEDREGNPRKKDGYKVYIYWPNENHCGIVTTDPTRKAFEGLDLRPRGNIRGARWAHTDADRLDVRELMEHCKNRLYQHAQQVTEEIGHVPCVPLERYHELIKKYGNTNPVPDLSRFDMKEADQLMDNGTLEEAADVHEGSGGHPRSRTGWEHGVYIFGPPTNSRIHWSQEYIVANNTGKVGQRETPAMDLHEAKKIADERNICIIRARNEYAKFYPNLYHFERDIIRINIQKDPVVCYKKDGEWIDAEPNPLRSK